MCGKCCSLPGVVWVNDSEVQAMADHLHVPRATFEERFTKNMGSGWWVLKKKPGSQDCSLLEDNACTVNVVKPVQCRTYPYWGSIMENPGNWMVEGRQFCEGINHEEAPLVQPDEIRKQLDEADEYFDTIKLKKSDWTDETLN
eukprot:tig00021357_g20786.t1